MMKRTKILLLLILLSQPAFADVMISEVLYNPLNTENGGEAVLLHNQGEKEVDVSGWVLATKASLSDATIPTNTSIPAGGYLLIADKDFSLNKDDSSWPDPNHEEPITLGNTDGGVALVNNGSVIDAVGWGDPENIEKQFYEGTPHTGVEEGKSLLRVSDTNNNLEDFIESTPIFFEYYNPLKAVIEVEVNVDEEEAGIERFEILKDDNSSKEGVQINPIPGKTKKFDILVEVKKEFENAKIVVGEREFQLEEVESNETIVLLKGTVLMRYYEKAREYELKIVQEGEIIGSTFFEYTSLSALSVDRDLNFNIKPGEEYSEEVIIRNSGNEDLLLKIKGTNLVDGEKEIKLENILFSTDVFSTSKPVKEEYQQLTTLSDGKDSSITVSFKISAKNTAPGNYNGQIIIVGETI